jgi:hypothetical protein
MVDLSQCFEALRRLVLTGYDAFVRGIRGYHFRS